MHASTCTCTCMYLVMYWRHVPVDSLSQNIANKSIFSQFPQLLMLQIF